MATSHVVFSLRFPNQYIVKKLTSRRFTNISFDFIFIKTTGNHLLNLTLEKTTLLNVATPAKDSFLAGLNTLDKRGT